MLQTVQEGLFLYTHGVSPYDGGVFYQVNPNVSEKINRVYVHTNLVARLLYSYLCLL